MEQDHFTKEVFPLYADVRKTDDVIEAIVAADTGAEERDPGWRRTYKRMINDLGALPQFKAARAVRSNEDPDLENFLKLANPERIIAWMHRHPYMIAEVRMHQEELMVQIQHKLIDQSAELDANLQAMKKEHEKQVSQAGSVVEFMDDNKV